jgi:hypothetical protein
LKGLLFKVLHLILDIVVFLNVFLEVTEGDVEQTKERRSHFHGGIEEFGFERGGRSASEEREEEGEEIKKEDAGHEAEQDIRFCRASCGSEGEQATFVSQKKKKKKKKSQQFFKVAVSFDGRLENFSWPEMGVLSTFLQAKTLLNKQQLALAVELWNTNPNPDCFQFLVGENEGRSVKLAEIATPTENLEHVMFREKQKKAASPFVISAPPAEPPRQQKKK